MRSKWLLLLMAGLAAACDGSTMDPADQIVPEEELEFLRFPSDLAPLVTREASFWAVRGDDRELIMRYAPDPDDDDDEGGEEFLKFKVPGDGLLQRPDGTRFQIGDSVLITVRVDPDNRFLFEFEPTGLRFDPDHRAELKVTYRRVGGDLNDDGVSDEHDEDLEQRMNFWTRERPGDPWRRIGTVKFEDAKEMEAKIDGFTGFCIAA